MEKKNFALVGALVAAMVLLSGEAAAAAEGRCVDLRVRDIFGNSIREVSFRWRFGWHFFSDGNKSGFLKLDGTICVNVDSKDDNKKDDDRNVESKEPKDPFEGKEIIFEVDEAGGAQTWEILVPQKGDTRIPKLDTPIDVVLIQKADLERLKTANDEPPARRSPSENLGAMSELSRYATTVLPYLPAWLRHGKDKSDPEGAFLLERVAQALERAAQDNPATAKTVEELEDLLSKSQQRLVDAYTDRGNKLYAQGNPKDAVKALDKAAALRLEDPEILTSLGVALTDTEQWERAESTLRQALKLRTPRVPAEEEAVVWCFRNLQRLYGKRGGDDKDQKLGNLIQEVMSLADSAPVRLPQLSQLVEEYRDLLLLKQQQPQASALENWLLAEEKKPQATSGTSLTSGRPPESQTPSAAPGLGQGPAPGTPDKKPATQAQLDQAAPPAPHFKPARLRSSSKRARGKLPLQPADCSGS